MPSNHEEPNESTRLLPDRIAAPATLANGSTGIVEAERPLPVNQVLLLCVARAAEPLAFFSLFSFVNQQVFDSGIPADEVGFYSGLIESLFSLTQVIVMTAWGSLADKMGRKPVLIISLFGIAFSQAAYGFTTEIRWMIVARCMAGLFAGCVVTIRTMMAELSTPATTAQAFSYFGFAGNLGIFFGPLVGGALSRPALQYPALFGSMHFFHAFPYALPCLVTAVYTFAAALLVLFFVDETLATTIDKSNKDDLSLRQIVASPGVVFVLFATVWTMMLGFAFTAVVPLFWFTPIKLGGLGWSPQVISAFFALVGASQSGWLLFIFPPLQRRYGTTAVWRRSAYCWPPIFSLFIVASLLRRSGAPDALFYPFVVFVTILGGLLAMPFTCTALAINSVAPSPSALGRLNGLSLTCMSIMRTISPAACASIYAYGIGHRILSGYLGWVVLIVVSAGLGPLLRWSPANADSRPVRVEEADA